MGFLGGWNPTSICSAGGNLYVGNGYGSLWVYAGGTSWNQIFGYGPAPNAVTALVTDGSNLFAGWNNGHVARYNAGWTDMWRNYGAMVTSLFHNPAGGMLAGSSNGQVYIPEPGAWGALGNSTGSPVCSVAEDGTNSYAGCADGLLYYNNAGTWTSTAGPGSVPNALAGTATVVYAGCADGHLWYYDGTWHDGANLGSPVNALAFADMTLYAGTDSGQVYRFVSPGTVASTGLRHQWRERSQPVLGRDQPVRGRQ